MLTSNPLKKFLSVSIVIFSLLFFSIGANAASSCKGSSKSSCSASSDCYWVDSFKRKDGVKVSAHCRTKAGKGSSKKKSKASSSKKGKSSKETKKSKKNKTKKDSKTKDKKSKSKAKKKSDS